MITNMIIFWPVMPYSPIDMYGRFRGTCYYLQVFFETSVHFYQTTRGHLPVHRYFRNHRNGSSNAKYLRKLESKMVGNYKGEIM